MKRKYYFILSAIAQIFINLFVIINAKKIIDSALSAMSFYPVDMQERVQQLFTNSGYIFISILAIVGIILNIFILYWAIKDRLLVNKRKIIGSSIYAFLTSFYPITELIAIINIIVIVSCKPVRKDDYPEENREMPKLERESINSKKIVLAILLLAIYFSRFLWNKYLPDGMLFDLAFYIGMMILAIIFFRDLLNNNFTIFRKNFKAYFQNLIGKVGLFYLIYIFVALLVVFLSKTIVSANQTNLESLPIWYSFPLAVFYAPLVEETLFRGCIRRFIKNDIIFIIISGLTFGLLHTVFTETSLYSVFVLAIPYATMGCFLAYLYVKTNNICTNMAFHAFHNTLAMIMSILIRGI